MNSDERIQPNPTVQQKGVSFRTLGLIIGSAVIGSAVTILFMRVARGSVESLSTIGLLAFFFMAVLAVSATALAITAIILSRTAERVLDRKSKELTDVQVHIAAEAEKTAERLGESVMMVGEGIVEAVCERFDAFGDKLRAELWEHQTVPAEVVKTVEHVPVQSSALIEEKAPAEEIAEEPIEKTVVPEAPVETEPEPPVAEIVSEEAREKAEKRYGEFKDIVLRGITNYPGVVVRKVGEGQYRTEGDELVDGAFKINHESVAVCTFATNHILESRFLGESGESFSGFLKSLFNELKKRHFTRVFFVFDSVLAENSPYTKALNAFSSQVDAVTFAQFELFEGSPEAIIPELTERVSQLMALAAEEDDNIPELSFRKQMSAGRSNG